MKNEVVKLLNIEQIHVNTNQPRKTFDEEKLNELASSIKENGIIQPIIVEELSDNYFQIVAGERRYRASLIAGLKEIPSIIKKFNNLQKTQIAIVENIQREELNPLEEAYAYIHLMNEGGLKQEDIAKRVGKSRSAIANAIRLTTLEQKYIDAIVNKEISAGHARALLSVQNRADREYLFKEMLEKNISVRDSEKLATFLNNGGRAAKNFNVKKLNDFVIENQNTDKKTDKKAVSTEDIIPESEQIITDNTKDVNELAIIKEIEEKISKLLCTKVKLKGSGDFGKIIINYISYKDLERLYKKFGGEESLINEESEE